MNVILKSPYRALFLVSLLLHLACAWFNVGYFHADEHYQILEFAGYRLGHSPASDLPWEFHDRVRPTVQPVLVCGFVRLLELPGLANPFVIAFLLRLMAGVAAWCVTSILCIRLIDGFSTEKGGKLFVLMSQFLWFVPFFNARFSSENVSTILMLSGICLFLRGERAESRTAVYLVVGFLFGFAFFARIQTAFAMAGFGLWLVFVRKTAWRNIAALSLSFCAAAAVNVLIDTWFYGGPVFTPYRYFYSNIIMGKAASFGVSPWWEYARAFVFWNVVPLGLLLLGMFLVGAWRNRLHPFVWMIVPFVIAHSAIAHKELRFMLPVSFMFISVAAMGFDFCLTRGRYAAIHRYLLVAAAVITVPLLAARVVLPAKVEMKYYEYIYSAAAREKTALIGIGKDPYMPGRHMANFYRSPNVETFTMESCSGIPPIMKQRGLESALYLDRGQYDGAAITGYRLTETYGYIPSWLFPSMHEAWHRHGGVWRVYVISERKRKPGPAVVSSDMKKAR